MTGTMVPELWSKILLTEFEKQTVLNEMMNRNIVLHLGPNIGLTAPQLNAAIDDINTDPIIRTALITLKAKMRIMDTPPETVRVDQIYGHKIIQHR
jgi:hypothetical protein